MKIIKSSLDENMELPVQLHVSFGKIFSTFERYASDEFSNHPYHKSAIDLVKEFKNYPDLINGFSDFSLLEKYENQIDLLLEPLFPQPLLLNEIKSVSIPFSFTSFKFTDRFSNIIDNAGENYELNIRNYEEDSMYILSLIHI